MHGPFEGIDFVLEDAAAFGDDDGLAPLLPPSTAIARSAMTWTGIVYASFSEIIYEDFYASDTPNQGQQYTYELEYTIYAYPDGKAELNLTAMFVEGQLSFEGEVSNAASETTEPLTLYPALLLVPLGQHVTLDAKPEGKPLIWSSSNPSVATVDGSGRVTPVAEGEAMITVTLANDAGTSAACGVLVAAEGNVFLWE